MATDFDSIETLQKARKGGAVATLHQLPAAAAGPAAPHFAKIGTMEMVCGEHFFLLTGLPQWSLQGFVSPSEARDSRPPANENCNPPSPCYCQAECLSPDTYVKTRVELSASPASGSTKVCKDECSNLFLVPDT